MEAIIDFFISLGDFLINQIQTVIWAVAAIPRLASFFNSFFAYCPSFLLIFLEVSLALTILFAIIKLL